MLKTVNKSNSFSPTEIDSETEVEVSQEVKRDNNLRTIRVVDRFGIILQIFAARAKNRVAQIQIELAWLKYARSLLVRGGAPTFGKIGNLFSGNLMQQGFAQVAQVEIKSGKGGKGMTVGGSGETQLEIENQLIKARDEKLRKELAELIRKSDI